MKRQTGITLIALVITIIVLLILAGVSISAITGENGIVEKANFAKKATQKANNEEKLKAEILEKRIEAESNGENLQPNNLVEGKYQIEGLEYIKDGVYKYNGQEIYISDDIDIYTETKSITELNVGDIIEYTTVEGEYTATGEYTGVIEDQTFSVENDKIKCVVFSKSEDNVVKIIPLNCSTSLTLAGFSGFLKLETVLNNISRLYFNENYATSSTSIGEDDVYEEDAKAIVELYNMGYTNVMTAFKTYWPDAKRTTSSK